MFRNLVLTGEPAKGNFNKKEKQKAENITGGKENTEKEYGQIFWEVFSIKESKKNVVVRRNILRLCSGKNYPCGL